MPFFKKGLSSEFYSLLYVRKKSGKSQFSYFWSSFTDGQNLVTLKPNSIKVQNYYYMFSTKNILKTKFVWKLQTSCLIRCNYNICCNEKSAIFGRWYHVISHIPYPGIKTWNLKKYIFIINMTCTFIRILAPLKIISLCTYYQDVLTIDISKMPWVKYSMKCKIYQDY